MAPFNTNHPKYRSCCFGVHVAKLAHCDRSFRTTDLPFERSFLDFSGFSLTIFGAFAVFKEACTPIHLFIALSAIHGIISTIGGMALISTYPEGAPITVFLLCLLTLVIKISFLIAFWNLAQFIEDREISKKISELQDVHTERSHPMPAAAPAPMIPAARAAEEAPPPYEELPPPYELS